MNTIRFITKKREEPNNVSYKIPREIVHFLNEFFEKEESIQILRYFIFYLNEFNVKLLNWYDNNELAITLSLLENKTFKDNSTFDKLLKKKFEELIERKDEFQFVKDFPFLFAETKTFKDYSPVFEKIIFDLKQIKNTKKEVKKKDQNSKFWKRKIKERNIPIELQIDDSVTIVQQPRQQNVSLYEKMKSKKEKLDVNPMTLEHEWNGTAIRFRQPDGKWGKWVDLRGPVEHNTTHRGGGGGVGKRKIQSMIDATIAQTTFTGSAAFGSGPIVDVDQDTSNIGTSSLAARQDHVHFHGNLTGSELHNEATIYENGFLSSYDKVVLSLAPQTSTQSTIGDHVFVEYLDFI